MQPVEGEPVPVVPRPGHRPPGGSFRLTAVAVVVVGPAVPVPVVPSALAVPVVPMSFAAFMAAVPRPTVLVIGLVPARVLGVVVLPNGPRRRPLPRQVGEPFAGRSEGRTYLLRCAGAYDGPGRRGVPYEPVDRLAQRPHLGPGDEHDIGVGRGQGHRQATYPKIPLGREPHLRPAGHLDQQDMRTGGRGTQEHGGQVHRRAPSRQA